jgi:hypothetical protein
MEEETRKLFDHWPNRETWEYRRQWFSFLMGQALGSGYVGSSTNHARLLELEMEKVFCAGAWHATIVLAAAATEAYVTYQGGKSEAKFLKDHGLRDEWIWLTNRRKNIVHSNRNSPDNPESTYYEQPELEEDARRAVGFALKVLLLGTRTKLETSLTRYPE